MKERSRGSGIRRRKRRVDEEDSHEDEEEEEESPLAHVRENRKDSLDPLRTASKVRIRTSANTRSRLCTHSPRRRTGALHVHTFAHAYVRTVGKRGVEEGKGRRG